MWGVRFEVELDVEEIVEIVVSGSGDHLLDEIDLFPDRVDFTFRHEVPELLFGVDLF